MSVSEASPLDASLLKRRLLSGGTWAVGGKFGAALTGLASNALLARLLTPQEFGSYLLIISVVSVGTLLACLGLNNSVVRFVAEGIGLGRPDKARRAVYLVAALGLLGAVAVSLAYLFLGSYVGDILNAPMIATVAGLTAGWILISTLQVLFAEAFRGFHDVRLATLFSTLATGNNSAGLVTRTLFLACLVGLWISRDQTDFATIVLIIVATSAISTLTSGWILYIKVKTLGGSQRTEEQAPMSARSLLGVSMPLLVINLTTFALVYSDLWILAMFRSQEEVAIYGAAARFMTLVTMPLMIVNAVLPPMIAEMYARGEKDRLEQTMRPIATLTSIPAVVTLLVFMVAGGPILGLVYGGYYQSGALILILLSLGKLASVWAGSCGLTLQMTGHQNLMMWISIASGVIFVVGALLVVRQFGAVGVASVAVISITLQNVITVIVVRMKTGLWTHAMFSVAPVGSLLKNLRVSRGER